MQSIGGINIDILMYIVYRQRRGNCDLTPCIWASLGWYCLEDNKGWRRCYICRGLQPSKREVIIYSFQLPVTIQLLISVYDVWNKER